MEVIIFMHKKYLILKIYSSLSLMFHNEAEMPIKKQCDSYTYPSVEEQIINEVLEHRIVNGEIYQQGNAYVNLANEIEVIYLKIVQIHHKIRM